MNSVLTRLTRLLVNRNEVAKWKSFLLIISSCGFLLAFRVYKKTCIDYFSLNNITAVRREINFAFSKNVRLSRQHQPRAVLLIAVSHSLSSALITVRPTFVGVSASRPHWFFVSNSCNVLS